MQIQNKSESNMRNGSRTMKGFEKNANIVICLKPLPPPRLQAVHLLEGMGSVTQPVYLQAIPEPDRKALRYVLHDD